MASEFAFGFSGEGIDVDAASEAGDMVQLWDEASCADKPQIPPKRHTFEELLSTLPSRLSYNLLNVPFKEAEQLQHGRHDTFCVPRRALFDVRQQLMAESSLGDSFNDDLLSGLESGDISSGRYEGGFKTWECAVDLAGYVAELLKSYDDVENLHVIELGAGSAIPTLTVLQAMVGRVKHGVENGPTHETKISLCDYNEDVLRLVTVPNLLLAWYEATVRGSATGDTANRSIEAELDDISQALMTEFGADCQARKITFDFVSGAWGKDFVELLASRDDAAMNILILASETIYSPLSLSSFTDSILALLAAGQKGSRALIAAKKLYFGVGGSVNDFISEVQGKAGQVEDVLHVRDEGVERVILSITIS